MDVAEARAVLGIVDGAGWDDVRAAYRRLIRAAHPDIAGGTSRRAARLNEAYAVLSRAKRSGAMVLPGGAPSPPPPPPPPPPAVGFTIVGDDTLLLAAAPGEAFALLLDAGHRVGSVSYVDRSCGIFEVVVREDGEARSLLVTLEPRAHGTEAVFALESLERAASLPPERLIHQVAAALH
ncbi:MAG: J domain-containing protein [Acidimicrobiales bacterium]